MSIHHPKNVEKLKIAGQKTPPAAPPAPTSHRPLAPPSSKKPTSDITPLTKTPNSRKNMPSPHPFARDTDINPEKYDA
jgi:hypothetical protein